MLLLPIAPKHLFMQNTEANEDEKKIGQKPRLLGPLDGKACSQKKAN